MDEIETAFEKLSLATTTEPDILSSEEFPALIKLLITVLDTPGVNDSRKEKIKYFIDLISALAENDVTGILSRSLSEICRSAKEGVPVSTFTCTMKLNFLQAVKDLNLVDLSRKTESWKKSILPHCGYSPEKYSVALNVSKMKQPCLFQ
jgi:hypothetical protein